MLTAHCPDANAVLSTLQVSQVQPEAIAARGLCARVITDEPQLWCNRYVATTQYYIKRCNTRTSAHVVASSNTRLAVNIGAGSRL